MKLCAIYGCVDELKKGPKLEKHMYCISNPKTLVVFKHRPVLFFNGISAFFSQRTLVSFCKHYTELLKDFQPNLLGKRTPNPTTTLNFNTKITSTPIL